jgi:LysR family transcriptional regulator for bpeEF and oprC
MDTLYAMRVFVRIVGAGSLTKAADSFGSTAPKVSKLLQGLEHRLGCRLLQRTTRKVSLTEDGRMYYERCVSVLNEIDDMEGSLSHAKVSPQGRLKVNLPMAMAKHIVIPALPAFVGLTDRHVDVVGEGVDCVVRVGTLDDSGLVAKRIGMMQTCTCASPDYLALHGMPETIDDLDRHVGVNYVSADTGRARNWDFMVDAEARVVQMRGSVAVNDADAYVACALAGLGIAKTAMYLVEPYLRTDRLKQILRSYNAPARPISVLYVPNRHLPKKLKVFIEFLSTVYAANPVLQGDAL